jgi:hypothetical protein
MIFRRLAFRFSNQLRALWKLCLSFRKHDWELSDYPVTVRELAHEFAYSGPRLKQRRFWAQIVNWHLSGAGNSKREALLDLERNFAVTKAERLQAGEPLPRPGLRVQVKFASQELVNLHPELAEDFMHRVLEMKWAWLSDESILSNFHTQETNDSLVAKIMEIYGVDVSDIESARLWEILERIAKSRRVS